MLVLLGIGCVDSPSILLPVAMIVAGAIMIAVSAIWEARWTEE